ncbi:FKBP-type peptidyl-prolyl cis-trans isomerase [Pseudactinotalea sp. HY158]|uniref:FKBP-type peptidyl-prolyl cis-trans isomerase n=1 Tax=Pseudactinotalea sp. HY158 TaxID=2654547 RepID=UPI00129CDD94|nr:FKBP-type peptidyl-prolyl cis-trans isomerase [Pseudactinotalea sp. HY158]QGH69170.1 FKBP-type peptidyl-prolyl cis-trans isomerase [Pseudactinotalea sp. HY158]
MSRVRAVAGLLAVASLLFGLLGCTEDVPEGPLDRVEVTGDFGRRPQLIAPVPLVVQHSATETIIEGDGRELADGDPVLLAYLAVDAQTGETIDDSYTREPRVLLLSKSEAGPLYSSLLGAREGTRLLRADPPTASTSHPTLVVYDILHTRAWGEELPPPAGADDLPTVTLGERGEPEVTIPDAEPPSQLEVVPLIRGTGPQVRTGGTITVQYTSVAWDTGEVLETTWGNGNAPQTLPFEGLIPAWQGGLTDATAGSQYMIIAPPEDAFGTDTVVFVIDVLAASTAPDPAPEGD